MMGSRYLSLFLSAVILLGPTTSFAQGFDFGSDDTSSDSSSSSDNNNTDFQMGDAASSDNGGGITFDTNDVNQADDDDQRKTVAVVALPGPQMSPERRLLIENKMNAVLKDVHDNNFVGSDGVINALQSRGMLECVREPICLGAVGVNNNVDEILLAQLLPGEDGNLTLVIDLFEAKDKLTLRSQKQTGIRTNSQIEDAIKPMLYSIFDVREARKVAAPPSKSLVSPIIAWSSLGLALGAAGAGAYFTYQAKTLDDKLKKQIEDKAISQVDAQKHNETIKEKQTVSFVFYGLAGGLAAVSTIFFFLNVGADVSQDQDASIQNLRLTPLFSHDGAGLSAHFNF